MVRSLVLRSRGSAAVLAGMLFVSTAGSARAGAPEVPAGLVVPSGFAITTVAHVPRARELTSLPNGDLLVGTRGRDVYIIPGAESVSAGTPSVFASMPDDIAAGVAFSRRRSEIYIATENGVYATAYTPGRREAAQLRRIAQVRTGPIAPGTDGDVHTTTSVAVSDATDTLYVAVGSSCNACVEADPTRASIFEMRLPGGKLLKRATRIRNAIALAIEPGTGKLWAGDAGQDDLPFGHPYEFLDDVSAHAGVADYGWPQCEENRKAYAAGADCSHTVTPLVELPAYSTIIGAVFYPQQPGGRFAFPRAYRGTLFAAVHGSWHRSPAGGFAAAPQVVSIAMRDGRPAIPVDWQNPNAQWRTFVGGFQAAHASARLGRPTGVAVGSDGSLFVADDAAGAVYRVRPQS